MKVVKPSSFVPIEWLWDYKEDEKDIHVVDPVDKSTVVFGIFIIDKFAKDSDKQLQQLIRKVETDFAIWNDYYPWSEYNGISLSLEKLENEMPFIYGQLCAENNVSREEKVLLGLLIMLSKRLDPQMFIRVRDTDGDFIMNEISEALPKEYEFPVACNRLWLNCGKMKLIPLEESCSDGLRPLEALRFLEDSAFKLLDVDTLSNGAIVKMTANFPNDVLSRLVKLQLVIENEKHRQILVENPRLISFLLKSLIDEELSVTDQVSGNNDGSIELLVSEEHADLIPYFFEAKGLRKDTTLIPILCGRAISDVMEKLLRNRTIVVEDERTVKAIREGSLLDLTNFRPASIDLALSTGEDVDLTKDLLENLQNLLDGEVKIEDSLDFDNSDEDASEDLDEGCRKYFEDEGIDIDEDDFLEFFLKEGLKLDDDMIGELRADSVR
ncbi:hypothetical protein HG536_0A07680 [Torulaspora globosa]|uniref:Uncharacterized protein n=1 Tax=Torulaspora globosa TaxID=48254 RepID=A0A7G3ZBR7_9SACH|nr:uncharacterized protein HG536_0A07680 [Torulaspora globosa]QLL30953.1 hypothetical protein HG536_0A07680 [Torulaspora globosa]